MTSYERLKKRFQRISRLENGRSILTWDEAVVMPVGSAETRNQTMAELTLIIQELTAAPEVEEWLADAERLSDLSEWQRANVREMKRIHVDQSAVPPELTARLIHARMSGEQKWREMRDRNDWPGFLPQFREVLNCTREVLSILSQRRGLSLYDTALSQYSPGLRSEDVERLFAELKSFIPGTVNAVIDKQVSRPVTVPRGRIPQSAQKSLATELMGALGFDFDIGRLDESHHPFCGGYSQDVRITTRYAEENFLPALMGVLHETGHALYDQHLPAQWMDQPVGASAGMAIHESQSLLMEMQICRSPEFMEFAAPVIRRHLGPHTDNPESLSAENLTRLISKVERGFIRVDADEVTYPAHVILRYEIERGLVEGRLHPEDLPDIWDQKMRDYLGLGTKGDDRRGCLQDVHWPGGAFGYFPAYTFGAVIAAHLFRALEGELPDTRRRISRGDFAPIRDWLNRKVWSQGTLRPTLDLVRSAAGELTADAFKSHIHRRYLA